MIISKETIAKIKELVENKYSALSISLLGNSILTAAQKEDMKRRGIDISNDESIMDLAYNHNFLNVHGDSKNPTSVEDMQAQQSVDGIKPEGEAYDYAVEHANENMAQLIDKLKTNVSTRLEGFIRDTNNEYKANALQNLNRTDAADELVKESMVSTIKQKMRDSSGNANKDWGRVASTELSNIIGLASADRIVAKNQDKPMDEVYVFRIVIDDPKLCKFCRKFYVDNDGTPKVYKLSTLLSNGSNYGKKNIDWKPTIQVTHPNERCSQIIEIPVGYKVVAGGKLTYIGREEWEQYIRSKVTA